MFYFLRQKPPRARQYSAEFSTAVENYLLNDYRSPLIHVSFSHYDSVAQGLELNARRFAPNFAVCVAILVVFSLACSIVLRPNLRPDLVRSKPLLALAGLVTALLAIISAFGLMLMLGVPFNVINTIMPFLALVIGLDDMFIMMACWNRSDRTLSTELRMADTLSHAAVSITITSLTDVLSFAIGCITELPGIWLFCSYACVAIVFTFFYQLSFFAAVLAFLGDAECQNRHCLFFVKTNKMSTCEKNDVKLENHMVETAKMPVSVKFTENPDESASMELAKSRAISIPSKNHPKFPVHLHRLPSDANEIRGHPPSFVCRFFRNIYGPVLLKTASKIGVAIVFFVYLSVALFGCVHFKEGLNPGNLVTVDHYVADYFDIVKRFWIRGTQLHIVVQNPPDFSSPIGRERLMAMVRAFENTEYTMGREGTMFFFLEYLHYLNSLNAALENTGEFWNKNLRSWLQFTGGATWVASISRDISRISGSSNWEWDIVWPDDKPLLAFRLQVAMKNLRTTNEHKLATKLMRKIADSFPDLNITVFHDAFPFADQYLIILPATLRNIAIALTSMIVVSLLLIPSFICGLLILASIVSINVGVFGYMTLWGVNLDAVSMISIIMSIGFAVDLSAHICYAYVTINGPANDRALQALETLGWPIFQGAFSTLIGILVLATAESYIILTFFKTIWLAMVFGLAHGLVFLPVVLTLVINDKEGNNQS